MKEELEGIIKDLKSTIKGPEQADPYWSEFPSYRDKRLMEIVSRLEELKNKPLQLNKTFPHRNAFYDNAYRYLYQLLYKLT